MMAIQMVLMDIKVQLVLQVQLEIRAELDQLDKLEIRDLRAQLAKVAV
jgi:hypothetical protein